MRNQQALVDLLKHFVDIGVPGCALTVSERGRVVFEHYEGLSDIERRRPFGPDTVFRAYSCSKPITVAAAMILLERGKLLLTDPLEKYLPSFANPRYYDYNGACGTRIVESARSITVKDLMTMTHGLPYGGRNNLSELDVAEISGLSPHKPTALRDFAEQVARIPLAFEPGTRWMYGLGCDILGAVIEEVSGKSLGEFLRDEIFAPLGMDRTGFFLTDDTRGDLAAMYTPESGVLRREEAYDRFFEKEHLFESGGGGLLSTIGDMTKFSQMMAMGGELDGVRILSRGAVDLIRMDHLNERQRADFDRVTKDIWPNMLGYSFGLCCRTMVDPARGGSNGSLGEFAWSGAAGTYALIDPERQISAEYAHQLFPSDRNMQGYCHPRLRNAIYGALG